MVNRSACGKGLRGLLVSLGLSLLPLLVLAFTLSRSGCWESALQAAQGECLIHGVPGNPWREFLPLFAISIVAFVGLSWMLGVVLRCSWPIPLRLASGVLIISLASVIYGCSMDLASIAYLWFQDTLVIGKVGSSVLFWVSVSISFVFLGVSHYRLMLRDSTS